MYAKRTLYLVAVLLVCEAAAILLIHSRMPRADRGITAAINVIAAAVLLVWARQQKDAP